MAVAGAAADTGANPDGSRSGGVRKINQSKREAVVAASSDFWERAGSGDHFSTSIVIYCPPVDFIGHVAKAGESVPFPILYSHRGSG